MKPPITTITKLSVKATTRPIPTLAAFKDPNLPAQVTSHTAVMCVELSSTDRPTLRLTPGFTPERSLTAVTPVGRGLFRLPTSGPTC